MQYILGYLDPVILLCFPSGFLATLLGKDILRGVLSYADRPLEYVEGKSKAMGFRSVYF